MTRSDRRSGLDQVTQNPQRQQLRTFLDRFAPRDQNGGMPQRGHVGGLNGSNPSWHRGTD
jgi:hypothetical protein